MMTNSLPCQMFHQRFLLFAFLDQVQGDLLHRAWWWFWDHASIICSQSWPAIPYGEAPPLCGDDSLWGQSAFRQVAENTLQNCSAASLAWIALEITCLRAADSGCQGIKKWVFVRLIQSFRNSISCIYLEKFVFCGPFMPRSLSWNRYCLARWIL